jgi:hypothetical protein
VDKRILLPRVRERRAGGSRTGGGRDVRDKWTKLRCGKPRSLLGKVVEQVDSQVDEVFEQRRCRQTSCSAELEPAGHDGPERQRTERELG